MSDYVKATNFYSKDALLSGNPDKIIKGAEIDDEYNAIAVAIASKANLNSPNFTGTPTVPTATIGTNTTQVASCAFAIANGFPSGGIVIWSGSSVAIPTGWLLCDGTNGTPDLRNKFIVGAGSTYAVGATGGSADAVVVSHTHTINDSGHTHTWSTTSGSNFNLGQSNTLSSSAFPAGSNQTNWNGTNSTSKTGITVNSSGVSGTNANLPPYYALCYIMKV